MSQHESFSSIESERAPKEAIFKQDGSLNEEFLSERYGLGAEEANQYVVFGSYNGTVAQMLNDEKCPVGGLVSYAYDEKGIKGVAEKLKTIGELDPRFSINISDATLYRESLKKK